MTWIRPFHRWTSIVFTVIVAAIFALDEAEALLGVEELHLALGFADHLGGHAAKAAAATTAAAAARAAAEAAATTAAEATAAEAAATAAAAATAVTATAATAVPATAATAGIKIKTAFVGTARALVVASAAATATLPVVITHLK